MAFKDKDFIEIKFDEFDESTNTLIATTDEEKAKKAGIYNEKGIYGKALFIFDFSSNPTGLLKKLKEMSVGEKQSFVLDPEEAYGNRDESKVRVASIAEFRSKGIHPEPGMQVNIDGELNIIRSVGSGRVVIDANNPFAGRKIRYDVEILDQIKEDKNKIEALAKNYNIPAESITIEDNKILLSYTMSSESNNINKDLDKMLIQNTLAKKILDYLDANEVIIQNKYTKKEIAQH
ncbi:MAG: hypothetical protein QXD11_00455 [Candidatus Micrarchaeaceae archaeon]